MQTYKNFIRVTMLATAVVLAFASCGGDDDDTSAETTVPASESEATAAAATGDGSYCDTAQDWAAHELVPYDTEDPAAVEKYMGEWVAFAEQASSEAPQEIRADWATYKEALVEQLVPLMEKYGYSRTRIETEATDDERAILETPPDDLQAAQDNVIAYEGDVCATAEPEAADVEFAGPADSDYCEAVVAEDDFVHELDPSDAAAVGDALNSDEYAALDQALLDTAPSELSADITAVNDFDVEYWIPLLEEYGYSLADVLTDGTTEEIAILNHNDERISDAFARVLAYEIQLCGIAPEGE